MTKKKSRMVELISKLVEGNLITTLTNNVLNIMNLVCPLSYMNGLSYYNACC